MSSDLRAAQQQALVKRLARVEGQIRGIQAMVLREENCEAIAQQFSAARRALDKAYQEMLACLLEEAVLNPELDKSDTLLEVRKIFTKYT
ncbi:transcriptional regulator [Thiopseudomonas alkaliphila]|uniref:Metal-sensing transcriptional repressor n=1 Tax=Thiopseudomonas alkaliphila TaxID=1697053 RepID=A0A0K1XGQ3_9GAMM|nr:metal-sensing transcriptional repressor [Thiopseudomonas alkaliphila]AKX43865.1 transcriptional regulator [Thiopseudomonas alkaliphila]AKX46144.1 transcriptional regulator [Thiopseudomonas alkaliphila]AKX49220.1 transcriptional regulator [Thiopseudomonas alkaliphila]AKX51912.1 transcriptional regulator [Thiopseudomonas alkaliphila]AKX52873.1 transcriptional regulator [Thiopseudomonas alkaliphila]